MAIMGAKRTKSQPASPVKAAKGSKRKASKSQPASPVKRSEPKKQKVLDPVEEAIMLVRRALTGELGDELAAKDAKMVDAITEEALSLFQDERSVLEEKLAELVGEALKDAGKSLAAKAAEAASTMAEENAKVDLLTSAVEQAVAVKGTCDEAVVAATAAEKDAKDEKNTAQTDLFKQTTEEGKLDETKEQLESERSDLQFALDTVRGEVPSAKDSKRLLSILAHVEAQEVLLAGLPAAVGKTSELEMMFINEACKILDGKMAETLTKQGNWDVHTAEMATLTKKLEDQLAYLTHAHEERMTELATCKADQKAAAQGIKDAEASQKAGKKILLTAESKSELANASLTYATETYGHFEMLFTRKSPAFIAANAEPIATEEFVAVPETIATEEFVAADVEPMVSEAFIAAPEPMVTEAFVAVPEPMVTEAFVAVPEPMVTETFVAVPEPIVTETVAAVPQPMVTEPVVAVPEPMVTEPVAAVPEPMVTEPVVVVPEVIVNKWDAVQQPIASPIRLGG